MNTLDELVRSLHTKMPMATQEDAIAFAHRLVAELAMQEPVAKVVDAGGFAHFQKLQWVSANHSLKTPIGIDLYAAPGIPAGWVMVPVEPTEEMLAVYRNEKTVYQDGQELHKAMLSAAPKGEGK